MEEVEIILSVSQYNFDKKLIHILLELFQVQLLEMEE